MAVAPPRLNSSHSQTGSSPSGSKQHTRPAVPTAITCAVFPQQECGTSAGAATGDRGPSPAGQGRLHLPPPLAGVGVQAENGRLPGPRPVSIDAAAAVHALARHRRAGIDVQPFRILPEFLTGFRVHTVQPVV